MLARVNSPVQWQPGTRPPTFAPTTKTHVTDRFGDQQPIDARSGVEAGHARVETSSLTGFRGYSPRLQERLRTSGSVLVCNHVRSSSVAILRRARRTEHSIVFLVPPSERASSV